MKIHNALAAIALAVVGFGCQGDRTAPSGSQPGQMQGPADGRLIEDLSIGVVNGPGEYAFGRVSDVAMGPDGSIYVADAQAAVVRHYDAGGRFIRNLGREGSGPGEFVSPEHLAISPDGRVLIGDLSGRGRERPGEFTSTRRRAPS